MENKKCEKCGGRGYILNSSGTIAVCDCQKESVYSKLYDFVGANSELVKVNVDEENYNIVTINGRELSFQQSFQYIIWNWKQGNNLNIYIQGPTGTGKTLWANKLIYRIIKRVEKESMKIKNTAYLIDNETLLQKYKDGWKDTELKKEVNNILSREILIIDEFLKLEEDKKDKGFDIYDVGFLSELLSQRMKGSKITVLISNEPIEEVILNIDDNRGRISSRLRNYEIFKFKEGKHYKDYREKEKEVSADNFDFDKLKEGV